MVPSSTLHFIMEKEKAHRNFSMNCTSKLKGSNGFKTGQNGCLYTCEDAAPTYCNYGAALIKVPPPGARVNLNVAPKGHLMNMLRIRHLLVQVTNPLLVNAVLL